MTLKEGGLSPQRPVVTFLQRSHFGSTQRVKEGDVPRSRSCSDRSTALFEPQDVSFTHRSEWDASGLGEAAFRRFRTRDDRVEVGFVQDDKVVCHESRLFLVVAPKGAA